MRKMLKTCICALVATASLAAAPSPRLSDPYMILGRARQYWEAGKYPKQMAYGVVVTVVNRGIVSVAHYHSYYDAAADKVKVNGTSDEELAHPYTPHGINMVFTIFLPPWGGTIPLSAPQQSFDFLGVPKLTPTYSFGMAHHVPVDTQDSAGLVRQIRRDFNDPARSNLPGNGAGLKTIATVETQNRDYVVTLAGETEIHGHPDYDLHLTPVSDPGRYRLREAWINCDTFATDRVITQGNFVDGGMTGIRWSIDFTQLNDALYIASEESLAPFALGRRRYEKATLAFEGTRATSIPARMDISIVGYNSGSELQPLTEP